jgi:hypothetical protein
MIRSSIWVLIMASGLLGSVQAAPMEPRADSSVDALAPASPKRSSKDEMIIKNNPIARSMFTKPGSNEWLEIFKSAEPAVRDEFQNWATSREDEDLPIRGQKKKVR